MYGSFGYPSPLKPDGISKGHIKLTLWNKKNTDIFMRFLHFGIRQLLTGTQLLCSIGLYPLTELLNDGSATLMPLQYTVLFSEIFNEQATVDCTAFPHFGIA